MTNTCALNSSAYTNSSTSHSLHSCFQNCQTGCSGNRNFLKMATTSENSSSDDHHFSGSQGFATSNEVNMNASHVLQFSKDEEALIVRMYNLVGERWTLIAGRIPGRTAEEIQKYWVSRFSTNGFFK